jgi:hypothetical protein
MEDMAEKKRRQKDSHAEQQYGSSDGDSALWKMAATRDEDFGA